MSCDSDIWINRNLRKCHVSAMEGCLTSVHYHMNWHVFFHRSCVNAIFWSIDPKAPLYAEFRTVDSILNHMIECLHHDVGRPVPPVNVARWFNSRPPFCKYASDFHEILCTDISEWYGPIGIYHALMRLIWNIGLVSNLDFISMRRFRRSVKLRRFIQWYSPGKTLKSSWIGSLHNGLK